MKDVHATDLLKHSIDLTEDARPVKGKASKYTAKECDFANEIFPAMENAGIITLKEAVRGELGQNSLLRKKGGCDDIVSRPSTSTVFLRGKLS